MYSFLLHLLASRCALKSQQDARPTLAAAAFPSVAPGAGHQEVDEDECWSLGKGVNDEEAPTTGRVECCAKAIKGVRPLSCL